MFIGRWGTRSTPPGQHCKNLAAAEDAFVEQLDRVTLADLASHQIGTPFDPIRNKLRYDFAPP